MCAIWVLLNNCGNYDLDMMIRMIVGFELYADRYLNYNNEIDLDMISNIWITILLKSLESYDAL